MSLYFIFGWTLNSINSNTYIQNKRWEYSGVKMIRIYNLPKWENEYHLPVKLQRIYSSRRQCVLISFPRVWSAYCWNQSVGVHSPSNRQNSGDRVSLLRWSESPEHWGLDEGRYPLIYYFLSWHMCPAHLFLLSHGVLPGPLPGWCMHAQFLVLTNPSTISRGWSGPLLQAHYGDCRFGLIAHPR